MQRQQEKQQAPLQRHCDGLEVGDRGDLVGVLVHDVLVQTHVHAAVATAIVDASNLRLMSMNSFHWILIAIDFDENKVLIYDSMRKPQEDYQDMIDIIQGYIRSIA